ncbi:flagellin hook IN motif-containing protein [Enterovirga sp.]|jgi:flagellin-like hook-associated protein FlgL|uniref:flagellin N-terminal helical domain-containing protein n=1 Tax=Enterovirga sp. TaxID=2026350 RepID=UPI002622A81B|nr:flagellin hook IN motif-containing protein [Enterovirga sp.]
MSDIVLSNASRNSLLALQNTSALQQATQNRLATGKRVNTALDNATSFFTAQGFSSRANALTALLDSMSNSVQTLKAADSGITSISRIVAQLKSTTQQALQSTSAYTSQATLASSSPFVGASAADLRGTAGTATVTGTATLTTYTAAAGDAGDVVINGRKVTIAAGDTAEAILTKINNTANIGVTAQFDAAGKLKLTSNDPFSSVTISGTSDTPPSTAASLTALGLTAGATASTNPVNGKTLTFAVGTGVPLTVRFGDPATTPDAVKTMDDLNSRLASIGLSATLDGSGKLSFSTTTQTASQTFSVTGTLTGVGSKFTTTSSTLPVRGGSGADARDNLVTQYNNLLRQIDTLAKDSSFNGINLLTGDTLSILFNEKNTSRLDVAGTSATSSGLGLSAITAANFADGNAVGAILSLIEGATGALASQASRLGSTLAVTQTRQDFTKQIVNTLTAGADALVNADLNEEGANLLALQTKQSLSQTALSLSAQADQSVLKLFG